MSERIKVKEQLEKRRIAHNQVDRRACNDFSALLAKKGKGVSDRDKELIETLTRDALRNNKPFPDKLMPLFSPLILDLVTKVLRRNPHLIHKKNDLIQEGYMGLVVGLKRFDPKAKNKVTTYVFSWIRRMVLTYTYQEKYLVETESYYHDLTLFIAECFKKKMTQDQIYSSLERDGSKWLVPSLPGGEIRRVITSTLEKHISLILFEISFDTEDFLEVDEKKIIGQDDQIIDETRETDNLTIQFREAVLENARIAPREKSICCDWFGESGDSFDYYSGDRLRSTSDFSYDQPRQSSKERKKREMISSMYLVKDRNVRSILGSLKELAKKDKDLKNK